MKSKHYMKQTYLRTYGTEYCWEGYLIYRDGVIKMPREVNFRPNRAFLKFLERVKGNYYYLYTHDKWEQQYIEPLREKPYYEHKNKPCTKSKSMI